MRARPGRHRRGARPAAGAARGSAAARSDATGWIANRANELLASGWRDVKRVPVAEALDGPHVVKHDYLDTYVSDLENVVDLDAIRDAGVRIGADPLGGASVDYWGAIGERYGLNLTVVNLKVDPTPRSEERRVGKECRSRWSPYH